VLVSKVFVPYCIGLQFPRQGLCRREEDHTGFLSQTPFALARLCELPSVTSVYPCSPASAGLTFTLPAHLELVLHRLFSK
jgi:hypothetical protein